MQAPVTEEGGGAFVSGEAGDHVSDPVFSQKSNCKTDCKPAHESAHEPGQEAVEETDLAMSEAIRQKVFRRTANDFMRMNKPGLRPLQEHFARQKSMTRAEFDDLRRDPAQREVRAAYRAQFALALNRQMDKDARYLRRAAALDVIRLAHGMNAVARLDEETRL